MARDSLYNRIKTFFGGKSENYPLTDYPVRPRPMEPFTPSTLPVANVKKTEIADLVPADTPVIHGDGSVTEANSSPINNAPGVIVSDQPAPLPDEIAQASNASAAQEFDLGKTLKNAVKDIRNGDFEMREVDSSRTSNSTEIQPGVIGDHSGVGAIATESHRAAVDATDAVEIDPAPVKKVSKKEPKAKLNPRGGKPSKSEVMQKAMRKSKSVSVSAPKAPRAPKSKK